MPKNPPPSASHQKIWMTFPSSAEQEWISTISSPTRATGILRGKKNGRDSSTPGNIIRNASARAFLLTRWRSPSPCPARKFTPSARQITSSGAPRPTAPADIAYGRPGPWVGHGVLPKVVQHRNVLIAIHRVRPCPIYDQPPWYREDRVHAYFPRGLFDEVVDSGAWCFGRKKEAFIALRSLSEAEWMPPGELSERLGTDQPYEWNVDSTDVVWICEMGNPASHGSFEKFVQAVSGAAAEGNIDHVVYDSPSLGLVETGWEVGLTISGANIPIRDYPRFSNPYSQTPFGSQRIKFHCGDKQTTL